MASNLENKKSHLAFHSLLFQNGNIFVAKFVQLMSIDFTVFQLLTGNSQQKSVNTAGEKALTLLSKKLPSLRVMCSELTKI